LWAALIALATTLGLAASWGAVRVLRRFDAITAGTGAYGRGDWAQAAERAREVLKAAPSDVAAIRLLARSSARLGRGDSALNLFDRLGPNSLAAEDNLLLSRIFAQRNRPDVARKLLWTAYEKDRANGEALNDLVRGLARDDELCRGVELAEELRSLPGWRARGEVALGLLRAGQDDPTAAALALEGALNIEPNLKGHPALEAAARKVLARHRLALGEPAQARAALGTMDDPESRWLLSRADLQEGKPSVASPKPTSDPLVIEPAPYVGTGSCARCHASIARSHRVSHHARTFWRGAALDRLPLPDGPLPDPANSRVEHTFRRGPKSTVVEAQAEGRLYKAVLEYAFGSGDRGLTPVARDESGTYYELRMSRYADGPAWDITSGHEHTPPAPSDWLGKTLSGDDLRRCIDCHTTAPRAGRDDAGALAGESGIGCERCHGPGGNHSMAVAAGLADLAIAPLKLVSGEPIVRLCGRCHSARGRTVSASDPGSIRFQATTLTWSRCYIKSEGKLDCVTCHDPHKDADVRPAFYDAKCLVCHGGAATSRCPVGPTGSCIDCHMPKKQTSIPHSPFTDHHIRVQPDPR
jgi:tetratricopeptide (TPR) repeat protein